MILKTFKEIEEVAGVKLEVGAVPNQPEIFVATLTAKGWQVEIEQPGRSKTQRANGFGASHGQTVNDLIDKLRGNNLVLTSVHNIKEVVRFPIAYAFVA